MQHTAAAIRPKKKHHKQSWTLKEKPAPIDWDALSDEKVDKLIELCARAAEILDQEKEGKEQP